MAEARTDIKYDPGARGLITEAGHGTLRDGPGWRSIIYFKGCNFRCAWCGSPDTMHTAPEVLLHADRVKYPDRTAASCKRGAIIKTEQGLQIDRTLCADCHTFDCARLCLDGAVERSGREATVRELLADVLPYQRAHRDYGVTLSGGEATLQWEFYMNLLGAFKAHGLHTAVETNGSSPRLPDSFPLLDLVICDLKHMDDDAHRRWTGRGNEDVLANIRAAAEADVALWVCIPVMPGINDGRNIDRTIDFLAPMRDRLRVELLGYHRLGVYKWRALGRDYKLDNVPPTANEDLKKLRAQFRDAGLAAPED